MKFNRNSKEVMKIKKGGEVIPALHLPMKNMPFGRAQQ